MIIYNITLSINPELEQEVLHWLKLEHIPEVMETNLFIEFHIFKIVENPVERTHNSYAVQYTLESWAKFEEYTKNHAERLRDVTTAKYGENVLAYRTFLEKI
jgi:hypothetical protein